MTHPALALLRRGSIPEAIGYLRERDDAPAALALLEAGFTDYAAHVLASVQISPESAAEGLSGSARCHAAAGLSEGSQHAETGQSGHVRRRA